METKEKSIAYQIAELTWKNCDRSSYSKINSAMQSAVTHAILSGIIFDIDDFKNIVENFSGGYWIGANGGGKGYPNYGEGFYMSACGMNNTSACLSFEKWAGFKPFIIKNRRVAVRSGLLNRQNKKHMRVTGFDLENHKITFVCYDINDHLEKGPKTLLSLTNKEWLEERKRFELM